MPFSKASKKPSEAQGGPPRCLRFHRGRCGLAPPQYVVPGAMYLPTLLSYATENIHTRDIIIIFISNTYIWLYGCLISLILTMSLNVLHFKKRL